MAEPQFQFGDLDLPRSPKHPSYFILGGLNGLASYFDINSNTVARADFLQPICDTIPTCRFLNAKPLLVNWDLLVLLVHRHGNPALFLYIFFVPFSLLRWHLLSCDGEFIP
jgi:hypothetical protein